MLRTRGETGSLEATRPRALGASARLALAAVSLVSLVVALVRWGLTVYAATHTIAGRYDFSSYFAAAYALRGNLHANIYDASVLARAGAASHVLVNPPLPYTYPPLFALALSPFTALSFRLVSRLWLLGSAALWLAVCVPLAVEIRVLLGDRLMSAAPSVPVAVADGASPSAALSRRSVFSASAVGYRVSRLRDDPAPLVALAAATWLTLPFAPALQTMLLGQINFLVLLPLAVIPWLTRHGHERWVGVMVALAAMLKFTPAILILYLLLRRRWEAALAACISLAALALGSVALVGPGAFLAMLPEAARVGAGDATLGHNQALFAPALTALAGTSLSSAAQLVARALVVLLALAFGHVFFWGAPRLFRSAPNSSISTFRGERRNDRSENAAYAVALCAMVLVSPTAWVHHYVWILPAAAIALGLAGAALLDALRAGQSRRAGWQSARFLVVLVACGGLGYSLPYAWDTQPHPAVMTVGGIHVWPLALEMRPLATLLLVVVLLAWIAPPRRPAHHTHEGYA